MIKLRITILINIFCFILSSQLFSGAGTNSGLILKLNGSARVMAMGGGGAGLGGNLDSLALNPAGLTQIFNNQLQLSHMRYYERTVFNEMAYAGKIKGVASAFKVKQFIAQDAVRDDSGAETGNISIQYMQYSLGFALPLIYDNSIGLSLNYVQEEIYDNSSSGFAADLGWHYVDLRNSSFGIVFRNLGGGLKTGNKNARFPTELAVGGAHWVGDFIFTWEFSGPELEEIHWKCGAEAYAKGIFLRCGMINEYKTKFSFGFGIPYNRLYLDYAFIPHHELGSTHRMSMGVLF